MPDPAAIPLNPLNSAGTGNTPGDIWLAVVRGEKTGIGSAFLRCLLWFASLPYGWVMQVRNWAYQARWLHSERVAFPVISVGNLTVGGTGKTPAVEWIAGFYRRQDLCVAILSRGYGQADGGLNDEARVLYDNLPDVPHLQGKNRVVLAHTAIEELESELLVLDDGFQHRRLQRNLDVVLIDATQPWGYGSVLPRGLLREPRSGLRRAHLVLLTRCDQVEPATLQTIHQEIHQIAPGIPCVETSHGPLDLIDATLQSEPLEPLRNRPVAAFCGLGNPGAFRQTLRHLGCWVVGWKTYPDHHAYSAGDIADLESWILGLRHDNLLVVTTQKDLVKLRISALNGVALRALRIQLRIRQGQDILEKTLLAGAGLPVDSFFSSPIAAGEPHETV